MRYLRIFVDSLGGRLFLLPASASGLVGFVAVLKGLGLAMPDFSWWAIAFFLLLPVSTWSIVGLTKKVIELDTKLSALIDEILYSVVVSPMVQVKHEEASPICQLSVGFNIRSKKPIHYKVVELKGTFGNIPLPVLADDKKTQNSVMPDELRWFLLPQLDVQWAKKWEGELEYQVVFGPPSEPNKFFITKKSNYIATPSECYENSASEVRGLNNGRL